jgi:hypothetical protein
MSDTGGGSEKPTEETPQKLIAKPSEAWRLIKRGLLSISSNIIASALFGVITSAAAIAIIRQYYSSATKSMTITFLLDTATTLLIVVLFGILAVIVLHLLRHERAHRLTREERDEWIKAHGGLSRMLANEREKYSKDICELRDDHTQAQEDLARKHLEALNDVGLQIDKLERAETKQITAIGHIRRFSAECERNDLMFFRSFTEVAFNKASMKAIGERVVAYIHLEIQGAVDKLKDILDGLTGDECSVCVKHVVDADPAKEIVAATLETTYRDTKSAELRGTNDQKPYTVGSNTITIEIIANSMPFWGKDDLWSEFEAGRYKNSRNDPNDYWHDYYNATIGAAILAHEDRKFPRLKNCALLCADNKTGHLNADFGIAVMRIFAARLGVLLFRMRNLVSDLGLEMPKRRY